MKSIFIDISLYFFFLNESMSFYITDIFCYLKEENRKLLAKKLDIIFPKSKCEYPKKKFKTQIQNTLKKKFLKKLKKSLLDPNENLLKRIFLEGGFIEIDEEDYKKIDFPFIEFNNYIYLPNELYEVVLYDDFFREKRYLIGLIRFLPERELRNWLNWIETYTSIPAYFSYPLKKESVLIKFYFYILLSPLTLNFRNHQFENFYNFEEFWDDFADYPPLIHSKSNLISFYKVLSESHHDESLSHSIFLKKHNHSLKEILPYFLSGKLVPFYSEGEIKKIVFTEELRDVEISMNVKGSNILDFKTYKQKN